MNIQTERQFDSQSFPGETFVLRRITEGLRGQVRLDLADVLDQLGDLQEENSDYIRREAVELEAAKAEGRPPVLSVEDNKAARRIIRKISHINSNLVDPAWVKAAFLSASLTVNDQALTAENLRDLAPSAFWEEVVEKINNFSILGREEIKN
jgi:hypothetical protein